MFGDHQTFQAHHLLQVTLVGAGNLLKRFSRALLRSDAEFRGSLETVKHCVFHHLCLFHAGWIMQVAAAGPHAAICP